ncbi:MULTISPECIES: hypothetical protein [unclassified Yoonia]|uniref:hypothetical protein n=1 Tax=unclassified Yoonia TaxID=2629118 RepID=UPI002AFE4BF0|nr:MULTISPECIES: hypothetical protein [unclassified Yoonia]
MLFSFITGGITNQVSAVTAMSGSPSRLSLTGDYAMAMIEKRSKKNLVALTVVATFAIVFAVFFFYRTVKMMTIPVGITQVNDAFGLAYARLMAVAMLAYLIFQRRVTEAVMISSGVKG